MPGATLGGQAGHFPMQLRGARVWSVNTSNKSPISRGCPKKNANQKTRKHIACAAKTINIPKVPVG